MTAVRKGSVHAVPETIQVIVPTQSMPQERLFAVLLAVAAAMFGAAITALFTPSRLWAWPFVLGVIGFGIAAFKTKPSKRLALGRPLPQLVLADHDLKKRAASHLAYVDNFGDQTARNVQVSSITVGMYTIFFEELPFVKAHEKQPLRCASGKVGTLDFDLFEGFEAADLPREGWLAFITHGHYGDITIPIVIRFLDLDGETREEIQRLHVGADQIAAIRSVRKA